MLHLRELSDLHLEHYYDLYDRNGALAIQEIKLLLPPLPTDKKSVLIVSGDLATARRTGRIVTFFEIVQSRFKHIIYVLGNHEHYGMHMTKTYDTIVEELSLSPKINLKKMTIAGNVPARVKVGDVTFLCGTMWTDYRKGDPETAKIVKQYINDHRSIIGEDGHGVPPSDLAKVFHATVEQFGDWMNGQDNTKTVVCTHHMPSYQCVNVAFTMDPTSRILNAAFTSDLDDFILKHQPAYWFFGHTHTKYSGEIGQTKLRCNPLGYPHERNVTRAEFAVDTVYSL
jgi:hypothetical protein